MADEEPKRLTIHLLGAPEDSGHVRLSEFLDQLDAIRKALGSLTPTVPGTRVYYRIVDAKHSSPFMLVCEQVVETEVQQDRPPLRVVSPSDGAPGVLLDRLQDIEAAQTRPPRYITSFAEMEPYRVLAAPLRKHVESVVLEFGKQRVELTKQFPKKVNEILGPDLKERGSVSGRLERVNIRHKREFDIFPAVGPAKVRCIFSKEDLERVGQALGKYVTADGVLFFKHWDRLPYKVRVEKLLTYEGPAGSLAAIRGLYPGVSGDLTSEQFIEKHRDEDDW